MRDWIENQWQNLFMYVPFLMAFGAAVYFSMTNEPNLFLAPPISVILFVCLFIKKIPRLIRGALLILFGFYYAATFTNIINTPQIKRDLHNINVIGNVKHIDYSNDKNKITLSVNASDIGAGSGVANIKISVSNNITPPQIGDDIQFNGGIYKPKPAAAPETFDYARWSYFNNLTATGYADDVKIIKQNDANNINNMRQYLHTKSNSFLSDTLILGYKSAISQDVKDIWTATGVGHIWSISGFHMTLVGGWIFALFYLIFRSVPYITRRIPARIPAIICSWFGLLFYLFLSGIDVATVRAFLMTSLIFLAFIFGRSAISMRNVALAFCAIFLINPHYVMQAGFQLSFAAVFGLVWLFTVVKPKMPHNKFLKVLYVAILTSVCATIFTAPFVAMHFGKFPLYSLIGNLIFLPIFSVTIMPLILIGTLTATFGFTAPNDLAHTIYDYAYQIAIWISDLPYATISVPHISNASAILFIIGFMCLILIKPIKIKVNYILFLVFMGLGTLCVYMTSKPIFYATYDNELVGILDTDGKLKFNKSRASNHYFTFDTWKQMNNEETQTKNIRLKHDNSVYRHNNIVYIQKFVPLMKNISQLCNDDSVEYIVSYFDIHSQKCKNKILKGGFVIYPNNSVKHTPTKRKWH